MTVTVSEDLQNAMREALRSQSLKGAALAEFEGLVKGLDDARAEIGSLKNALNSRDRERKALLEELSQLKKLKLRQEEIADRERRHEIASEIMKAKMEFLEARVMDHKEMMNTVFRNRVVKRTLPVSPSVATDQYGNIVYGQVSQQTSTEEDV